MGTTLQQITPPPPTVSSEIDTSPPDPSPKTTKITDKDAILKAKYRQKKLLKQIKDMQDEGKVLNEEQLEKVAKEKEWNIELERVEHNLM